MYLHQPMQNHRDVHNELMKVNWVIPADAIWRHVSCSIATQVLTCGQMPVKCTRSRYLLSTGSWDIHLRESSPYINALFTGLWPVLEGFAVTMHEGACETRSQIPKALPWGIWRTVRTSPSVLWQQTWQIGLNLDYNMTFSISPRECK